MNRTNPQRRGEIYLEFVIVGHQIKVSAIDAATGTEVAIFGPAKTSRADLERIAVRKLRRRLSQNPQETL